MPPVALPPPNAVEATGPKLLCRSWPGRTQVELVFSCVLPVESPLEAAGLELYAGLLGLELTHQLRERTGATYSISSRPTLFRGNIGALEVRADVAYEALPVALSFVPDLVDDLQRLDPDDYGEIKIHPANGFEGAMAVINGQAQCLLDVIAPQSDLIDQDPERQRADRRSALLRRDR